MHVMKVFEVRTASGSDLDDTLGVIHWEAPALPGTVSMRNTLYAVEDNSGSLLEGEIPWSDSLPIADWGTVTIERGAPQNSTYPPAMVAFALDSAWTDSIGPVCFVPSFQGGYPALIVARRLDQSSESDLMTFEEASASGTLLVTAYTRIQADSSMALARRALSDLAASGLSLGVWAERESLQIVTTPEFTASQVRQNSTLDPDAFGGLLNNGEFGVEALTAPLLTPIGPFRTGGSAVIAEIDTRSEMPMPGDPAVLAPMYLGLQSGHSFAAIRHLISLLREDAGIVDLREEYEAALDSLRGSSPSPRMPIDY
jgi:hypothetical protein